MSTVQRLAVKIAGEYVRPQTKKKYTFKAWAVHRSDHAEWGAEVRDEHDLRGTPSGVVYGEGETNEEILEEVLRAYVEGSIRDLIGVTP